MFVLKNPKDFVFTLTAVTIFVGLFLTIISWLGVCTESCVESHNYRFFGMPFELIGLLFFITLGVLHFLTPSIPSLTTWMGFMIAGALGAEAVFVWTQKYVIGQWCPVCLWIAGSVGLLALIQMTTSFLRLKEYYQQNNRGMIMRTLGKGISSLSLFAISCAIAFVGVAKPEQTFGSVIDRNSTVFGDKSSPVEIYIVTDWFCPACRRVEPILDKIYPKMMRKSGIIFVDRAMHPETMNFFPYNLSFMVKEKQKYFEIRRALLKLSKRTKTPSLEDVQESVKPLGVKYEQLNFTDIESGTHYFEEIAKTYNVNSTPTVVITDRGKKYTKKLIGEEITEANILKAIEAAKKQKS